MPAIAQQVSITNIDEAVNNVTQQYDDTVIRPILPNTHTKVITVVAANVQKLIGVSTIDEINLDELGEINLDEIDLGEFFPGGDTFLHFSTIPTTGGCNKCKKYNKTKNKLLYE